LYSYPQLPDLHLFPTRRSSDLIQNRAIGRFNSSFSALAQALENQEDPEKLTIEPTVKGQSLPLTVSYQGESAEAAQKQLAQYIRSEEHTPELQSRENLVCRLLL